MSFSTQLGAAIAAARTYEQIDNLSREIWAAHAARLLDDDSAQAAAEALEARKRSLRDDPRPAVRKAFSAPPKRRPAPRSPNRAASIARRRRCAASGALPATLACHFTLSETAALAIIAAEVRQHGACTLPIDAIAAKAGTSRTVVKRACRLAEDLGLVTVTERPRRGAKHLPNLVRIVSAEWRAWIDRGPKKDRLGNSNIKTSQGAGNRSEKLSEERSGESTPMRPGARAPVEGNDRLEAELARFESNVRARAAK